MSDNGITTVPDPATQPTMTVDEVAKWLHVSTGTVYDAIKDNRLPSIWISKRRVFVPTAALLRVLLLDDGRIKKEPRQELPEELPLWRVCRTAYARARTSREAIEITTNATQEIVTMPIGERIVDRKPKS